MGLKVRAVDFFADKFSCLPFQATAKALRTLRANNISINLCGIPLNDIKGRFDLDLAVLKINRSGAQKILNPINVADNIKTLGDPSMVEKIKSFGIKQIDASTLPAKIWSYIIYKSIPCVLFGCPDDRLRISSIQTLHKFYEFARGAKTTVEQGLIANILFDALSMHDSPSALHCTATRRLALMIAPELNLSREETLYLEFAAYLHDIGKLAIDKNLLEKRDTAIDKKLLEKRDTENNENTKWNYEDTDKMRMHILFVIELLTKCGCFPKMVIDMAGLHHVLKPYFKDINPKNLSMVLQILPVLDAYDTMISGRYKEKMTDKEAFFELYRDYEEPFLELKRNYGENNPKVKYAQRYNFNRKVVEALELVLKKGAPLPPYGF